MTARISVRVDVKNAIKGLNALQQRQIPFATAKTLTDLAKDVQDAVPERLERDFEKPRQFTKRGTFRRSATKTRLEALVGFKDRQAAYLLPQIVGGKRETKKIEQRLLRAQKFRPSKKQALDAYGNLPKRVSKLIQEASKELNTGDSAKRYFAGNPKGQAKTKLPFGVYARVNDNTSIVPLAVFMREPKYEKRFSLSALANEVVARRFSARFEAALAQALASAK